MLSVESLWISGHSSPRIEALNRTFQAVKARARGSRQDKTFSCLIYLFLPLGFTGAGYPEIHMKRRRAIKDKTASAYNQA